MSFETEYPMVNQDLTNRFDVQPMSRAGEAVGDVLQISLPNGSGSQLGVLLQAFMRASRLPFPPAESYWAGDVLTGVGKGTTSLVTGVRQGVSGVLHEPYRGAVERGFVGMSIGIVRGIGGFVLMPMKGGFDFIAQPIVGFFNTPQYIYRKLTQEVDATLAKEANFKIFGIEEQNFERARYKQDTDDLSDEASMLLRSSHGDISYFIDDDDDSSPFPGHLDLISQQFQGENKKQECAER